MRMWGLFPELTRKIITNCLDEPTIEREAHYEMYAAYSIMARLVDLQDPGARKAGGSVDAYVLRRHGF